MSVLWSHAATGLSISMLGLAIGRHMVSPINRPNLLRLRAGEALLASIGLLLTVQLFFFGFRLFWDNGLLGLLQILTVSLATALLLRLTFLHNGLTPFICCAFATAQAIRIW